MQHNRDVKGRYHDLIGATTAFRQLCRHSQLMDLLSLDARVTLASKDLLAEILRAVVPDLPQVTADPLVSEGMAALVGCL